MREASRPLRSGDVVEVRLPTEILATLDDDASLGGMPFMPEMVEHVGRRFTVSRRVEKICATAGGTTPSRRMQSTVYLDDLRCDGSGHDGCQAGCLLYWREDWLRPVVDEPAQMDADHEALPELTELSERAARAGTQNGRHDEIHRCQATTALLASQPMSPYDPRQYVREVTSGNVGVARLVRVLTRAACLRFLRSVRLRGRLPRARKGARPETQQAPLLRPGDQVEIRPWAEIATTLNRDGCNRGLAFDPEMIPYCGGVHRVRDRVERFIDDRSGRMVELGSDCLILEGVTCSGEHSIWGRWFCPRAIYPFWRDAWLHPTHQDLSEEQ